MESKAPVVTMEELNAIIDAPVKPASPKPIRVPVAAALADDSAELDALIALAEEGAARAAEMAELAAWTRFLRQHSDELADRIADPQAWAEANWRH